MKKKRTPWNKNRKTGQIPAKPFKKGNVPWNKGLPCSKETKRKIRKTLKSNPNITGKASTPEKEIERRLKISKKMKKVGGGYRKGSGRGRKGWYKDYWCDSSWELAFVIYCVDYNIPIERNTKIFPYTYNNKIYKYIPDFVRLDRKNYYIEVKGYFTEQVKEKVKQFPYKLKIFCGNGMKKYLNYVIKKYGKDFIKLYKEKLTPVGCGD